MSAPTISQLAATLRAFGITSVRQMEEITTELLCRMPTAGAINGELSGDGNPTGAYYPVFVGQLYHDTTADTYYRSTGTGVYDWVLISGGSGTPQITFVGNSLSTSWLIDSISGVQTIALPGLVSTTIPTGDIDIENMPDLTLVDLSGLSSALRFTITNNTSLTSVDLSSLTDVSSYGQVTGNSSLISLSLTSLETLSNAAELDIIGNTSLASISLSSLISMSDFSTFDVESNAFTSLDLSSITSIGDGSLFVVSNMTSLTSFNISNAIFGGACTLDLRNNGLDLSSINSVLARCVSSPLFTGGGFIKLEGGTNAPPFGQGAADVITMTARGVTVTSN